jgi:rubrerythrin
MKDHSVTVTLNPLEIFEIAEQIERNGVTFYRKAAALYEDPDASQLFLKLAEWEAEHEKTFAQMKQNMFGAHTAPMSFKSGETRLDPKMMAGLAIFGIRAEPTEELDGRENQDDILRKAVEKEKDSIVFYNGLKDFLSNAADRESIDRIITEEMRHIRILHESLNTNNTIRSESNEKV